MHSSPRISLKRTDNDDLAFCLRLYYEGRKSEIEAFGWGEEETRAFVRMQFDARERAYRFQFPGLVDEVVIIAGSEVGRMLTFEDGDLLTLVDIALLPSRQGLGIGTSLLHDLQTKASKSNRQLSLHVDKGNLRAIAFYKKLGFVIHNESQIQYSMCWQAGTN